MISTPTQQLQRVLIVDDEPSVRDLLAELVSNQFVVDTAASANEALSLIESRDYAVVLCDIDMPGTSGIEVVPEIQLLAPSTVILMISGNLSLDCALQAIRRGAHDYITKPFDLVYAESTIRKAVDEHIRIRERERHERDLEELVKLRTEELNRLIYTDSITKLPNRIKFEDRLSHAIMRSEPGAQLGVLVLSLDSFAKIRNHFGVREADRILQEISDRLRPVVGNSGCLSLIQSDEFAILVDSEATPESVGELASIVRERIRRPLDCQGTTIVLTSSIGVSLFPVDGTSALDLLQKAGNAMGRARDTGGDKIIFYSDSITVETERRIKLESGLRGALERSEFEVYYQPKVSVVTGRMRGVEALVRWHHPEYGMISPLEFVPIAEETGLIVPLGENVLRSACLDGLAWHRAGYDLEIAVNVSARQLNEPDLADRFETIIRGTGITPSRINLEVTESSIMEDMDASATILERLKALGVQVSLDDFGTGYSSLAHLRRLPIDVLKIDREFIRNIKEHETDSQVTSIIINLARTLHLKVVAEGVEKADQLDFLRSIRCDEYQGYFFSKPVPADQLTELLRKLRPNGLDCPTPEILLTIPPHFDGPNRQNELEHA